jgi:hypothetical protein
VVVVGEVHRVAAVAAAAGEGLQSGGEDLMKEDLMKEGIQRGV